jgi:putative oxidoreductase
MKALFAPTPLSTPPSVALLLLRVVLGLAFMLHGWMKIQNPMGWMGPDAAIPGIFLALAAISEFFGGLAWILGLLTRLASFGILCTMAVATYFHFSKGDPFVSNSLGVASYEPALVYFCIAAALMTLGPGKFSADAKIFK